MLFHADVRSAEGRQATHCSASGDLGGKYVRTGEIGCFVSWIFAFPKASLFCPRKGVELETAGCEFALALFPSRVWNVNNSGANCKLGPDGQACLYVLRFRSQVPSHPPFSFIFFLSN